MQVEKDIDQIHHEIKNEEKVKQKINQYIEQNKLYNNKLLVIEPQIEKLNHNIESSIVKIDQLEDEL